MTLNEAVNILKLHNQWRRNRDDNVVIEMQSSTDIGIAIDLLCKVTERSLDHGYFVPHD